MFKTCYVFLFVCLCFGFIIFGVLLVLFLSCIRTIIVSCVVFFDLFHIWLSHGMFFFLFTKPISLYVCMYECMCVCMF